MRRRTVVWALVATVALVAAMAYGSARMARKTAEAEVADEATAVATAMLQAYSDGDYDAFSAAFTDAFRLEMGPGDFEAWRAPLYEATGALVEITDVSTRTLDGSGGQRVVIHADFAAAYDVRFAVTFKQGSARANRVSLDTGA